VFNESDTSKSPKPKHSIEQSKSDSEPAGCKSSASAQKPSSLIQNLRLRQPTNLKDEANMEEDIEISTKSYDIHIVNNPGISHQVLRFQESANVDFTKVDNLDIQRENIFQDFSRVNEKHNKYMKAPPEKQPGILDVDHEQKFKVARDGGVAEDCGYYAFSWNERGSIDAIRLNEWYSVGSLPNVETMSAEEAEKKCDRKKISLQLLKTEDNDTEEVHTKILNKKITEHVVDTELKGSCKTCDENSLRQQQIDRRRELKRPYAGCEETVDDSDHGVYEGRELGYADDIISDDRTRCNLDDVAEKRGLRELLDSDSSLEDVKTVVQPNLFNNNSNTNDSSNKNRNVPATDMKDSKGIEEIKMNRQL